MQDQVALRAFERICKGQGTEAAVKKLRDETPELWRETVMRFRDTKQASSTGRVKFDRKALDSGAAQLGPGGGDGVPSDDLW